jgi:hypothetical protein
MFERLIVRALVDVTTTLHHFAPACNGESSPTWRAPNDAGFPAACAYDGAARAVAVGKLSRARRTITWAKCKAADEYWAEGREAYSLSDESKGRGCLNEMHAVGTIHCGGRLACKLGGLRPGDNSTFDRWTQPLIHGPPGSKATMSVSSDLGTVRTPSGRKDGFLAYNLPNDAPGRTWFSWVATRNDESPHTTCP